MGIRQNLRDRLEREGIRPSARRGQNFLIDANQLDFIAGSAGLTADDLALEVGPGTGLLTRRLAASGCRVLGVELDAGLLGIAREETAGLPKVTLMPGDILAGKHRLNPQVETRLAEWLEPAGGKGETPAGRLKCVSNLPYSAGTPFIMNLLSSPLPWRLGIFLLQREVAERLTAAPGGGDYGQLSIGAALAAPACIERVVRPAAFWPAPKVDSAVVRMEFQPVGERLALPWDRLRALIRAVFGARRKILGNALKGLVERGREAETLRRAGVNPEDRGERLRPDEFLRLARLLADQSESGGAGLADGE